jgi:hypothetical protein
VKMIIRLQLVPKLKMCGSIHPHPQYVFTAWCLINQEIGLHDVVLI